MTKNITTIAMTAGILCFAATGALCAAPLSPAAPADSTPAASESTSSLASLFGTPNPVPAQPAPAASTPAAAPAALATPVVATPQPAAAPVASTPAHFDIAVLAANRASWPRSVRLKQAIPFPAVLDGQVVGNITVPAGTTVRLDDVQGACLILNFQGGTQRVAWQYTSIQEQIAGASPSAAAPGVTATSSIASVAAVIAR